MHNEGFGKKWIDRILGKVDKDQGVANAGKVLGIGDDGQVVPVEQSGGGSGGYTEYSLGNLSSDLTILDKIVPGTILTSKVPIEIQYHYPSPSAFITVNDMNMVSSVTIKNTRLTQVATGIITSVVKNEQSDYTEYKFTIANGLKSNFGWDFVTLGATETQIRAVYRCNSTIAMNIRVTNGSINPSYSSVSYSNEGICTIVTDGFIATAHGLPSASANNISLDQMYILVPN